MANDDKRATPRHAAKHAAQPAATPRADARRSQPVSESTRRPQSVSESASRVRISDRSNVERQVQASRTSGARSRAGERRLTGSNRPSYGRREESSAPSRGPLVIVAIAAIVVLAILFFLIRGCVNAIPEPTDPNETVEPQQVQTTADDIVTYQGVEFSIDTSSSPAKVVFAEPNGGATGTLFELEGTPAALILYNGVIVVPENRGGSWDVIAYVFGADSLPTQVVGADGNPITGSGDITEATLDGSVVRIVDSTGATTDVALE